MISYKDKTWCTFQECKNAENCSRFLTDDDKEKADIWWGEGPNEAPICVFTEKPDCFKK